MRLTKEDRYGHFYTNRASCRNIWSLDGKKLEGEYFENQTLAIDGEAIDKLGQLEDVLKKYNLNNVEELDIVLNAYFKAVDELINKPQIMDRLNQLVAIEKELEIDFITLFKAVNNGFWFKKNDLIMFTDDNRTYWSNYELYVPSYDLWVKLADYGKTWALTKEELL